LYVLKNYDKITVYKQNLKHLSKIKYSPIKNPSKDFFRRKIYG